ncbi:MAG: glycosyltransferase [Methanocorpusculum parvum]|nr:glycosyltransferase [Methanocorpusculum parvum]
MPVSYYIFFAGIFLVLLAAVPYGVYLFGMTFGKKSAAIHTGNTDTLPDISIIVCAYNEERHIKQKIQSISACSYPDEKIELILVNDASSDNTENIAKESLKDVSFRWIIHTNEKQQGKNKSLNTGISLAAQDIVFSTDADLIWDKYSAERLVRGLLSDEKNAAGTGDLQPNQGADRVTSMEKTYRSFFGRMAEWEAAHDSTYAFNGCLLVFRKSRVQAVNEEAGADDANLAFAAIRNGYRTFYDSQAAIYEELPENLKKQYTQKVRRAKGLIQTTLLNRDLLKIKRPFSKIFYPLRIWMFTATPTLLFAGTALFCTGLLFIQPVILVLGVFAFLLLSALKKGNLVTSFITNQFYLFMGLYSRRKDAVIWQSTSKKVGE